MIRDMDLIRKILLTVEARPDAIPEAVKMDDVDALTLHRHVEMLYRAGFLEAHSPFSIYDQTGVVKVFVRDLTWNGHDFLSAIKNDGVWSKIKQSFSAQELASLPFDVLKSVGISLVGAWAKQKIGL